MNLQLSAVERSPTGYYQCLDRKFINKMQAIEFARSVGYGIHWNFHESKFNCYNWTHEPGPSLDELYRQRAQQLRDRYDYVILCLSGGYDSENAFQIFDRYNIKYDEVLVFGAFSAVGNITWGDLSNRHIHAELKDYVLPRLNQLNPMVKVTVYDYAQDLENYFASGDDSWIWKVNTKLQANQVMRTWLHTQQPHYRKMAELGTKIAFVWGVDKPRIYWDGQKYSVYFIDTSMGAACGLVDRHSNESEIRDEFFYWTPEMPELISKQAWAVMREAERDVDLKQMISTIHLDVQAYYDRINACVYPTTYHPRTYVKKPKEHVLTERDWWFYRSDSTAYQNYRKGLEQIREIVGTEWMNNPQDITKSLIGCLSKRYYIT